MILFLTSILAFLVFAACQEAGHPVLAWHLTGAIALFGGIWAGYDERVNRVDQ